MGPPRIVAVTGLLAEARLVAMPGVEVVCGPDALAALRRLPPEAHAGVAGWLSVGLGAGLDPRLASGALLVGSHVVAPDGTRHPTDERWAARLLGALPGARLVDLSGVDEPVSTVRAKARQRERDGTVALDMESHHVARLARLTGQPFAVLRAVADPAGSALPGPALAGWTGTGRPDLGAVLRALAREPWQLPALIRTGREAAAGLRALRQVREAGDAVTAPLSRVGGGSMPG